MNGLIHDNTKIYLKWKEQCAAKGKTPNDMVGMYRGLLDDEYLDGVQRFIENMENLSERCQ